MSALALIVILLICCGAAWLVNKKFGASIDQPYKFLINVVIIGVALYYFLVATGLWAKIISIQTPHV
jgi:hypothetical protein